MADSCDGECDGEDGCDGQCDDANDAGDELARNVNGELVPQHLALFYLDLSSGLYVMFRQFPEISHAKCAEIHPITGDLYVVESDQVGYVR